MRRSYQQYIDPYTPAFAEVSRIRDGAQGSLCGGLTGRRRAVCPFCGRGSPCGWTPARPTA